jgi:hypothetical protein
MSVVYGKRVRRRHGAPLGSSGVGPVPGPVGLNGLKCHWHVSGVGRV